MAPKSLAFIFVLVAQLSLTFRMVDCAISVKTLFAERQQILADEDKRFLGGSLTLNPAEKLANTILMRDKLSEYDLSFTTANFTPAHHFFQAKPAMLQSKVYQFIRQMPKGGALHVHDLAITPIDFVIDDASYRPNLYVCTPAVDPVFFKFALAPPTSMSDCQWDLVASRRAREGAAHFDAWLRSKFSLYTSKPQEAYQTINEAWKAFENSLIAISGIISYAPVFTDYFYQGLVSFHDDNVQYMEIRTTIPQVYLLDGTLLTEMQVMSLYQETFDHFRQNHPNFSGAKIIYAPIRRIDNSTLSEYISLAHQLKSAFPDTLVGFDLVGQEELGPPLKAFLDELLAESSENSSLNFFFHAGETDWEGTDTDENVVDAILLNATRIGHGFAISKHPAVMELAISKRVPIEVCPISNQVLGLIADLRNHPAASLFTINFPLVISSDDPASWESFGLSPDFYMAFMGLAGKKADLRTLKQLALNSIMYSAMTTDEKNDALIEWQRRWDTFIYDIYEDYKTMNNLT